MSGAATGLEGVAAPAGDCLSSPKCCCIDSVQGTNAVVVLATITAKGQVTVPKPIRDRLKLKPGDRIEFILDSGEVRMVPVTASVRQLKGMVPKPGQPVTLEQMDDAIVAAYALRR